MDLAEGMEIEQFAKIVGESVEYLTHTPSEEIVELKNIEDDDYSTERGFNHAADTISAALGINPEDGKAFGHEITRGFSELSKKTDGFRLSRKGVEAVVKNALDKFINLPLVDKMFALMIVLGIPVKNAFDELNFKRFMYEMMGKMSAGKSFAPAVEGARLKTFH